jgi:hypothetical protein
MQTINLGKKPPDQAMSVEEMHQSLQVSGLSL